MRSRTPADDIPHQTPELCEFQLDVLGKSDDLGASISCFYKDFLSYSCAGLALQFQDESCHIFPFNLMAELFFCITFRFIGLIPFTLLCKI